MFIGYQDEKIKFYVEEITNREFYPNVNWVETNAKYVLDNDEYVLYDDKQKEKELIQAKENKKAEALLKANEYINNGEALFEFEQSKHIEATDGNIGKFTAYLIGFEKGLYETVRWNTKEDKNVELNVEQVAFILQGLANVQSDVWTWKYPYYLEQIELAQTIEEVENIVIDYDVEVENGIEL